MGFDELNDNMIKMTNVLFEISWAGIYLNINWCIGSCIKESNKRGYIGKSQAMLWTKTRNKCSCNINIWFPFKVWHNWNIICYKYDCKAKQANDWSYGALLNWQGIIKYSNVESIIARLHGVIMKWHTLMSYILVVSLEVCNAWNMFINQDQAIKDMRMIKWNLLLMCKA